MILTSNIQISGNDFLREIIVSYVESGEILGQCEDDAVASAVNACRVKGRPIVICKPMSESIAAIACIPVLCGNELKSIVTLVVRRSDTLPTGVIEVWSPMGTYADLNLTEGYFAGLDRFQNVSSHVQFEKGTGLPGQAWDRGSAVIHDRLAEHPGFIRAAGASADALETAVGLPIFSDRFVATVVLISGRTTPLARAFEVWKPIADEQFELVECAYAEDAEDFKRARGTTVHRDLGIIGQVAQLGSAVASTDPENFSADRSPTTLTHQFQGGVAIPTYVCGNLACITTMVL